MSTDSAPSLNNNDNDDVHKTTGSAPNSLPGSPRNRAKFMCSHGGKILPRPPDGQLKYVGGETRVISVPKDISFQELMKKLMFTIDGETILKYQIATEDLDSLVSVKTDDDMRHMFDEVDRCEDTGAQRLRAFLFPKNPTATSENQATTTSDAEQQRYIDAINGILRTPPQRQHHQQQQHQKHQQQISLLVRSSPSSPNSRAVEATMNHGNNMHRVLSSPIIYNLENNHQQPQNANHHPHHQHLLHPNQYHHCTGGLGFQPPQPDRLTSVRSVGRAEGVRYQVDPTSQYYYAVSKRAVNNNKCCGRHSASGTAVHQEETAGQWPY